MNVLIYKSTIFFIIIVLFFSCKRPPEYDNVPHISLERIDTVFNDFPLSDSIILTISFTDGDADLGLEDADSLYPYNDFFYKTDAFGNRIKPNPSFPYNPYSYLIENDFLDTFLIERNPYRFNFYVQFLKDDGTGNFEVISDSIQCVQYNVCTPFHGKFTRLNRKQYSSEIYVGPLEGEISFTMSSLNFKVFGNKLKFRIYIYDRSLNKSNTVESAVISLK